MILNNNIIRLFSGTHSNGNQFVFALSSASSKYTTALVHRKAISSTHPPLRFQCDFDLRLCRCLLINYASPCCGKFFVIPSLFSTTVNSTTSRDSPMHLFFHVLSHHLHPTLLFQIYASFLCLSYLQVLLLLLGPGLQ